MKKFLSLLICVSLIMSSLVTSFAASSKHYLNPTVNWELDNGTLRITGYGEIEEKHSVYSWQNFSDQIVNIEISEGITAIGVTCFSGLDRLKNVTFPSSLNEIESAAFKYCDNLTTINLPKNLTRIEDEAFSDCDNLENISVPDSLLHVGYRAFRNTAWFNNQPDGQVYIGKVFYAYKGSVEENTHISIKDGTRGIACNPFNDCYKVNITKITLPNSLEYIGDHAFAETNITQINIPDSVKEIGSYAFGSCKSLENVKLPKNISQISGYMFHWCSNLKTVAIPQGVKTIASGAFWSSGVESLTVPNSVEIIGGYAFHSSDLNNLIIGSGVKEIGESACTTSTLDGCTYVGSKQDWNKIKIAFKGNDRLYPVSFLNLAPNTQVVSVILNNNTLKFDFPAIIVNGRTLVPLRKIFESMGATVDWDNNTKTVTSTRGSTTIQLTIGSNILYKNGKAIALDVPAQLINNRTMVPVRAVAEAFGADVSWNGDTKTVYITTTGNKYSVNSVPKITCDGYDANFADFNGMYIDSFTHKTNSDGSENVKFNVYNTQYIYGLIEIYNANGILNDVAVINKMSDSTSMKGALIDDTGRLIRDILHGTALTYKQESGYSRKTSVNIDIPKGGYIKITNDMNESFVASAINLADMVFSAKNTFSILNGFNSETSKNFVSKLSLKLISEAAFSEAIKNPEKYTDMLWQGLGETLYMNPKSVGGFLDTVSKNLDAFDDGKLAEVVMSTASDCGIDIAEGTFEALAGPAGVALKAMFTITSVTDVLVEMSDGLDCLYQGSISISAV